MALKYVSSIDLNLNQLLNAVVQNLASAPTSGNKKGRVYFDTSTNKPYWYNGSTWVTFASTSDLSTVSGKVSTLEGYFTNGKANNADKLDGVSLEGLLTALGSNTTNAVSITVGGTTKNITVATMKTSLGLKALAYKDSIDWSDIASGKPTTLSGYGITDAYTKTQVDNIAAKYLPLVGGTMTGTITFGTSGKSITAAGVANLAGTTVTTLKATAAATFESSVTVASGEYLILDSTANNYLQGNSNLLEINGNTKIAFAIDETNELALDASSLSPVSTGGLDLGTSSLKWGALYLSKAANVGGNLSVSGTSTFTGLATLNGGAKIATGKTLQIGNVVLEESNGVLALYYAGDKDGETNVASFYATGGVSALGLGDGGTGSGGGLIETVYGSSSLGGEFDDTNLTDTFNAYAINSIYNDLTAVKSSNTSVSNRLAVIEQYFSSSADSDATINKWNELVEFLDGVAETDNLATLLASKVGSVEVTGSGNAVTSASISGSKLTLTKGSTFLTSHQTLYDLVIKNSAGTTQLTYKPATNGTYSLTLTKAMVGLGNVENTALSSWAGSSKITTVGTITSGTWNGTKIANAYLANSAVTIAGKSVSLGGSLSAADLRTALSVYTKAEVDNLLAADSHTVKRFNATLAGDGTKTSFTVTHSFNTKDVIVFVYEVSSPYKQVFVDVAMTSTTAITVTFASAPASGTNYKVVILA